MANRLNVLVGATLEQNVEKKLNAELAKLNLNALELEAKFDNNFKDIVDNIKKAIAAVDFNKVNQGFKQGADSVGNIGKSMNELDGKVKKVVRTSKDLNGKLKSAEETLEDMSGNKYRIKVQYDESGKISGGNIDYIDNTARQKQLDLEKKSARAIDAQRKATTKEYLTRLRWQSQEEEKSAKAQKKNWQDILSTVGNAENVLGDITDKYKDLRDVDNKKFLNKKEIDGYNNRLNKLINDVVKYKDNSKELTRVQKELNSLYSELNSRKTGLAEAVETDKKAKVARKKYNDEVKKSKDLLTDLKKTATDSRNKLENLKSAFPEIDFSDEEKEVRSLEGAVRSYEKTVNATGKSTEYFANQQKKLNGWNSTAKSTSSGLDKRYEQEMKAAEKAVAKQDKAMRDAREKQLAAEEKYYKQELKWAEENRKAQVAAAEKAAKEQKVAQEKALKAQQSAEEKYNKKLYAEHQKLISSYKEVSSAVDDIYKQSEIPSYFDKSQLKQIDKFGEELNEIEEILKKDNVATWELIRAQERLVSLQNDASDFVSKVNAQKLAQEKSTASIEKQTASVREQLSLLDVQVQTKATRLGSRYGDLFNKEEFKQVYNLVDAIENELGQTEPDFKKINSYFKQMNVNASKFEAELAASAKELKQIEDDAKVFDSSLGRFIQFYGFGELFRAAKTGFTQMFEEIKAVDSSMVELKKVTSETEAVYDKFLDNSAEKAKALGVTMTDYIDSVTNFARMDVGGFYAAQEVAEVANIFQQVSENLTADQASEYLISNMKAWGYEASNAIEIVDVLNNLSNKYAITIDGLGESLTRSSAAMMSANNTLEQTAALTIAANNVIQDPLTVGNALKTVSIDILVA